MIFSSDRFSGIYGWFVDDRDFYEGCSPPPEQQECPNNIMNYLVAYQKPNAVSINADDDNPDFGNFDDENFYYMPPSFPWHIW